METEYKYKVTHAAADDLDAIDTYISDKLHAPMAAQNLMDEFERNFRSLCDHPYRCELSRNPVLGEKGYRKLVVKNYVALYLVDRAGKLVIIARIFYGAMDYEKYV
ncbi:MAG: type II toxin-antitoxin system RelE/ParE family toxin [Acidobacteriota bacterium]|jgi:plasmid stabilization system protein ParE|nr:type II toxin-antitoxin system RelE/ParE family toxin [Acidobacteriota bacterium]